MSNNNVINEKKKALLAYKEKILHEIKYYDKSLDEFRANHMNKKYYEDHADSSDSEDEFPSAVDMGPTITTLKLQQAMMKTCLHATQELTSLMVLQSEVDVLVEEPKFEGERPVTEPGIWREVTAECRVDLVPFTITFFMHTPYRKFAPPSYRGLRVVPVKAAHEMELSKSVLHSLKVPSDAVEVIRSYAAGYRSRRTTLARLANKYTNSLFMEPHADGGFILKCADLLEVSWRLENKWSPVAPFHHRMKFDLEFMEESYIKVITQAHKQLLDPALQTDERTLLLAQIITTCLEARGPIDPESDLESKTTERDNDIDRRDSETEKRDSEVMAPPKSLPKKGKQKNNKDSLPNTAQKRSMTDDNGDSGAKKPKNYASEAKKSNLDINNPRKSKMNDVVNEGGKKRKINEVKVVSNKNVKESDDIENGNTKNKNVNDSEPKNANTNTKPKNLKESAATEVRNSNVKTKNKIVNGTGDTIAKDTNPKPKVLKEPASINSNNKPESQMRKSGKNQEKVDNDKLKENNNIDNVQNKAVAAKKVVKETTNTEKVKNNANKAKNVASKETGGPEKDNNNIKTITTDIKKVKNIANIKSKENIGAKEDSGRPKSKVIEKPTNTDKNIESNANKMVEKPKTTDIVKVKNVTSSKNDNQKTKKAPENNIVAVANAKNDDRKSKKTPEINTVASAKTVDPKSNKVTETKIAANSKNDHRKSKKTPEINNVASAKHDNPKSNKVNETKNVTSTKIDDRNSKKTPEINDDASAKKAPEKDGKNKEKLPEVTNKNSEKTNKEKTVKNIVKNDAQIVKKVTEKNATNTRNKDKISQIITKVTEKTVKDQPLASKDDKILSSNTITKKTKDITNSTKNINKKPIINKIASHRNSLKPQNPSKIIKAGNTKAVTGNAEKENGGKGSKIPQKKLSAISEGSSKKNILRISPRKIPSKFKTTSHETFKQKMVKSTNIPRLLKKPAPKTT